MGGLPRRGVIPPSKKKRERGERWNAQLSGCCLQNGHQIFLQLLSWRGGVRLHLLWHPPRQGLWWVQLHRLPPADLALCPVLLWLQTLEDGKSLWEGFGLWEEDVIVDDGSCCCPDQRAHPEDLVKREIEELGEQMSSYTTDLNHHRSGFECALCRWKFPGASLKELVEKACPDPSATRKGPQDVRKSSTLYWFYFLC